MSNSLWPYGLESTPGIPFLHNCSNSSTLSAWRHATISFSVTPFSSCPQSLLASESFPVSWLFISSGQNIGSSASVPVLPMNIQGWFPLGLTFDLLVVQETLKSLPQHISSKASILQCLAFFMVQLSHLYSYWKNHSFDFTIQISLESWSKGKPFL